MLVGRQLALAALQAWWFGGLRQGRAGTRWPCFSGVVVGGGDGSRSNRGSNCRSRRRSSWKGNCRSNRVSHCRSSYRSNKQDEGHCRKVGNKAEAMAGRIQNFRRMQRFRISAGCSPLLPVASEEGGG